MQTTPQKNAKLLSSVSRSTIALALLGGLGLVGCTHREDTSSIPSSSAPDTPTAIESDTGLTPGAGSDTDTIGQAPSAMGTTGTVGSTTGERTGKTTTSSPNPANEADSEVAPPDTSVSVVPPPTTRATTAPSDGSAATQPGSDNSERNKRHTDLTAGDQGNDPRDIEITRQIRKSITGNDALSTYARNVKIITRNGSVVLKGPVRSLDEKELVENTARKVAGNAQVSSELTISPQ